MINRETSIAVIGHGSWATALVKILSDNKVSVNWYVYNEEIREHLSTHQSNNKYLSSVHFCPAHVSLYSDINEAISKSQVILLAAPSAFLKDVLKDLTVPLEDKFVISAIKGIVPDQYLTIAEYMHEFYGLPFDNIGVITGPCHAEEVALERLSYLTMACKSLDKARELAELFSGDYIKMRCSTDIYGAEYGAVLKNIYAIAVGVCHSLGYGDNFMAVLISNAAIEMAHFMKSTYDFDRDILASAYLGDLLVTCYSPFSRNRTFGQLIGKGYSAKIAQLEMNMVAEGYYATACIRQVKTRCGIEVEMPIADAMYEILYSKKRAAREIKKILDKFI